MSATSIINPVLQHYYDAVKRPGKFEYEQPYVPYFWDQGLEGGYDDVLGEEMPYIFAFRVTPDDTDLFPKLKGKDAVYLYEDEQGFVQEVDKPEETIDGFVPDEEDIYIQDNGVWQSGKLITDDHDPAHQDAAIKDWMDEAQYWPNVWVVSDHGNIALYTFGS